MTTISAASTVYIQQSSGNTQYQIGSTTGAWNNIIFPATIVNTNTANTLNVKFENNLTMTSTSHYFIMGGPNITLDGQNNTVNVSNVSDYLGLVQNGTISANGQNNIIIQNLGITSSGSTSLAGLAGWVGQTIMNRNATGCQVNNCYSLGAINGLGSGGIFGDFSSGTATNCYSSGDISGPYAGGIFGGVSIGTATNCYSSGAISDYAGGIFGGYSSGTATNCYSSGAISGSQAGGIFGAGSFGTPPTATNCYSSGAISGAGAQGIFGVDSNGTNTNSRNTNGWSDTTAAITLTDGPTYTTNGALTEQGTVWIDINLSATNIPWLLKSFNSQLYSPNTLTTTTSSGSTSNAIITSGVDYQIIDVNNTIVNASNFTGISSSGAITFVNLGFASYTVRVLRKTAGYTPPVGYQINTFTITYQPPFSDVSNIPLNMGPVQFSSVSVVGTNWTFGGIISTNSFIQESPTTFRIGNMTFGTI